MRPYRLIGVFFGCSKFLSRMIISIFFFYMINECKKRKRKKKGSKIDQPERQKIFHQNWICMASKITCLLFNVRWRTGTLIEALQILQAKAAAELALRDKKQLVVSWSLPYAPEALIFPILIGWGMGCRRLSSQPLDLNLCQVGASPCHSAIIMENFMLEGLLSCSVLMLEGRGWWRRHRNDWEHAAHQGILWWFHCGREGQAN